MDLELVSVMVDPLEELKAEASSRGIEGIVAADADKTVSNEYDAMEASMHPGVKPGHTFILIDVNGNVIWRWDWSGHGAAMYVEVNDLYEWVSRELGKPG
jgi:peroxiredoxin